MGNDKAIPKKLSVLFPTEDIGEIPTPYTSIATDRSEELDQFKASTREVLGQIDKSVVKTPGLDVIHPKAQRKLKHESAELLAKVCS